jgi:hypothetical protein
VDTLYIYFYLLFDLREKGGQNNSREEWKNLIHVYVYYLCDQVKGSEVNGTCSTDCGGKKRLRIFSSKI